jgi:hypothetical protein
MAMSSDLVVPQVDGIISHIPPSVAELMRDHGCPGVQLGAGGDCMMTQRRLLPTTMAPGRDRSGRSPPGDMTLEIAMGQP